MNWRDLLSERRGGVAAVAALVIATAATVALWVTRDDPARFRAAAEDACAAYRDRLGSLPLPAVDDRAGTVALLDDIAAAETALTTAIEALHPDGADTARDLLLEEARGRLEQVRSAPLDELVEDAERFDEAATALGEARRESFERVAAGLDSPWQGGPCAIAPLAGEKLLHDSLRFTADAAAACEAATAGFVDADRVAGTGGDAASYRRDVANIARSLADRVAALAEPPGAERVDARDSWVATVRAAAAAADAGDRDALAEANADWAAAGAAMGVDQCQRGVVPSPDRPSGLLVAPVEPIGGGGVVDGGFESGAWVVEQLMYQAGVNPTERFGLGGAVAAAGGGVALDGASEAVGNDVSISTARAAAGHRDAGAANPWVIGVAVRDHSGACTWGRLWGYPRLAGFEAVPADGPCTGDAAIWGFNPNA